MEFLNKSSIMLLELIIARNDTDKNIFYDKIYEAITCVFKQGLIKSKPKELHLAIGLLIKFYEEKEEYEKCHRLNETGMEIYNTISD